MDEFAKVAPSDEGGIHFPQGWGKCGKFVFERIPSRCLTSA